MNIIGRKYYLTIIVITAGLYYQPGVIHLSLTQIFFPIQLSLFSLHVRFLIPSSYFFYISHSPSQYILSLPVPIASLLILYPDFQLLIFPSHDSESETLIFVLFGRWSYNCWSKAMDLGFCFLFFSLWWVWSEGYLVAMGEDCSFHFFRREEAGDLY
jgi:hypothetical protein